MTAVHAASSSTGSGYLSLWVGQVLVIVEDLDALDSWVAALAQAHAQAHVLEGGRLGWLD